MKISIVSLLAVTIPAAVVQSAPSSLAGLPDCAATCFVAALPISGCNAGNQTCLCTSEPFGRNLTACVSLSCSIKESLQTLNVTKTGCGAPIRDRSGQYRTTTVVFTIIAGVFILQRFAFKIYAKLDFGLDDWFALLTMIVTIPGVVINANGMPDNGLGRDMWTLKPDQITNFLRYFYFTSIIYIAEVSIVKLSFLFFYMRIFPGTTIRWLLWGTIACNIAIGLAFTLVAIFQCTPVEHAWEQWHGEHPGTCLNVNAIAWSNACISIALDIWMLAIPLSQIRTLKLDWKKKLAVGVMFAVGTFVTIVSILRLKTLIAYRKHSDNITWDYFEISLWSAVEICVGIICACLPSLRLLLRHVFPKQLGTSRGQSGNYIHMDGTHPRTRTYLRSDRGAGSRGHADGSALETIKSVDDDAYRLVTVRHVSAKAVG